MHWVAGIYPEDPIQALHADQVYFFITQDIHNELIAPTNRIKDASEQLKARQELVTGALRDRLLQLTKLVESRPGKFVAGDKISHGDLAVFNTLSSLRSGIWKGIPTDILGSYPVLREFRNQIAQIPAIKAFYAKETDDVRKNGYTPDN